MQTISNREYYEGIKDKAVIIYDKGQNTEELSKTKPLSYVAEMGMPIRTILF